MSWQVNAGLERSLQIMEGNLSSSTLGWRVFKTLGCWDHWTWGPLIFVTMGFWDHQTLGPWYVGQLLTPYDPFGPTWPCPQFAQLGPLLDCCDNLSKVPKHKIQVSAWPKAGLRLCNWNWTMLNNILSTITCLIEQTYFICFSCMASVITLWYQFNALSSINSLIILI